MKVFEQKKKKKVRKWVKFGLGHFNWSNGLFSPVLIGDQLLIRAQIKIWMGLNWISKNLYLMQKQGNWVGRLYENQISFPLYYGPLFFTSALLKVNLNLNMYSTRPIISM